MNTHLIARSLNQPTLSMKKTILVTALFCSLLTAGITAIFMVHEAYPDTTSACRPDLSRKALLRVKDDYLRGRFPHWYREKNTLGTLTPELVFGEVTIKMMIIVCRLSLKDPLKRWRESASLTVYQWMWNTSP